MEVPKQSPPSYDLIEDLQLKKDLSIATLAKLVKSTPRKIWMLNSQISLEKSVFPAKHGRNAIKHTIRVPGGTKAALLSKLAEQDYVKSRHSTREIKNEPRETRNQPQRHEDTKRSKTKK